MKRKRCKNSRKSPRRGHVNPPRMSPRRRRCKRRRVRRNSDGSPNQKDMEHNRKCEQKYMLIDNLWMKTLLNKKNPKGYLLTKKEKKLKSNGTDETNASRRGSTIQVRKQVRKQFR
tara:strand:+ start:294 stop:641 length:348 start_codon:yes stop_codon:yes gene_type:complete